MRIGVIDGANLTLNPPKDWDQANGQCDPLRVRVEGGNPPSMTSAWLPTPGVEQK